ncbi:exodeoxyribonuclease VII large subunit [Candidatus Saccharibacteria bacterium]|nr:exodeoxyribonuclease VII large subunit [Candidatus Saccharibacteria bacterium]
MDVDNSLVFTPTEFASAVNQTLEYTYSSVLVTGEVASFKTSQGKWVFFDLKDAATSISCFMPLWTLRIPLADGMKVTVRAVPKLTKFGRFSLTVSTVKPVGEGSLKKAYELLKKKLASEGLFDPAKKRPLPRDFSQLGVISSTSAAGYADFIKILNARWGGIRVQVAHTQVQGQEAPDQIIRALRYFNERAEVDIIAILRGGGSADDLSCFNDEPLVREIAASRIPIITGIGHEIDESLSDLAADLRASTPSNAAELLTPDRTEELQKLRTAMSRTESSLLQSLARASDENRAKVLRIANAIGTRFIEPSVSSNREKLHRLADFLQSKLQDSTTKLQHQIDLLETLNPEKVLHQGYAILSGKISPGSVVKITTKDRELTATINDIKERN